MAWGEAKWVVDNLIRKIGQSPNNMRSFEVTSVTSSTASIIFQEPADSYENEECICAVKGVVIRMSTEKYPSHPNDGDLVIDNIALGKYATSPLVIKKLTQGNTYYLTAFPYSEQGVYNLSKNGANRAVISL
jgi:hypothetical protein